MLSNKKNINKQNEEASKLFNNPKDVKRAKISFGNNTYGKIQQVSASSNSSEVEISNSEDQGSSDSEEIFQKVEVEPKQSKESESGKKILLKRVQEGINNSKENKNQKSAIQETEEKKNNGESLEEDSEESDESSTLKKLDPDIEKIVMQGIDKISKERKAYKLVPKLIKFPDKSFEINYEKYLNNLSADEIDFATSRIFIPASSSVINGVLFEFIGAFLQDLDTDGVTLKAVIITLKKLGFVVPDRLVEYSKDADAMSMDRMLTLFPSFFIDLGRGGSIAHILKPPSQFVKLGTLGERRVAASTVKKVLSLLPEGFQETDYIHELLPIFYFKNIIDDNPLINTNKDMIDEGLSAAKENLDMNINQNKDEVAKFLSAPKDWLSSKIPTAVYLSPDRDILTLDDNQQFVKVKPNQFAVANKTSFSFGGPDTLVSFILANMVAQPLPEEVMDIMKSNYCGKGGLWMIGERYNKSWEIYQESNSKENKIFHHELYSKEFRPFLKEFGYTYSGPKIVKVPTPSEYVSALGPDGSLLYQINTKSKGTFSSFRRRNETAMREIQAGLSHFSKLVNNPKDEHYQFFYHCYKNISAKFKDEIHSFTKPPRFYNPTMIAGFIPFQLVLNKVFSTCPPLSPKCPMSLLGITDTSNTFSKLMHKLYMEKNYRCHYSDNFWIKEGDLFVSVDVQRCDSNLSKEALYCPLAAYADMVLSADLAQKFKILAELFVQTIPRKAVFSVVQGSKFANIQLPFYWLPSGVVGTPYFNHLFTGFFLYKTKNVKWLSPNGDLTPEILQEAKRFGIHLEVASKVDFSKIERNTFIPFDLLGRSGYWDGKNFIPCLEKSRVLKALLFMKKNKYDHNQSVSNFVRIAKMHSLIQLGALLYDDIAPAIITVLTICLAVLRGTHFSLTQPQAIQLTKDLDNLNIDPLSFERYIFKGFIPSIIQYKKDKTLDNTYDQERNELDNILSQKLTDFPILWASLLPVISGDAVTAKMFSDGQKGNTPYFVAHLFGEALGYGMKKDKDITLGRIKKLLCGTTNANQGGIIFKELVSCIFTVATSQNGVKTNKMVREGCAKLAQVLYKKYNNKKEAVKRGVQKLLNEISKDPNLESVTFKRLDPKDNYFSVFAKKKEFKLLPLLLKCLPYGSLLKRDNKELWNYARQSKKLIYINYIVSLPLFKGVALATAIENKSAAVELVEDPSYRLLELPPPNKNIFNPKYLLYMNEKMMMSDIKPLLMDLGYLTGYLTMYYHLK